VIEVEFRECMRCITIPKWVVPLDYKSLCWIGVNTTETRDFDFRLIG
jgi:hypothetical protein